MTNEMSDLDLFVYNGALPGSPAANSDLKKGDKILSINGIVLRSIDDWNEAIDNNREQRIIEVLRGNQVLTIKIDVVPWDEEEISHSVLN